MQAAGTARRALRGSGVVLWGQRDALPPVWSRVRVPQEGKDSNLSSEGQVLLSSGAAVSGTAVLCIVILGAPQDLFSGGGGGWNTCRICLLEINLTPKLIIKVLSK